MKSSVIISLKFMVKKMPVAGGYRVIGICLTELIAVANRSRYQNCPS